MLGLVSAKTTPNATPLHISFTQNDNHIPKNGNKTPSPLLKRTPSPSSKPKIKPSKKTLQEQRIDESSLDNPDLGPFLLKLAIDTVASGDNQNKALDYATRASISFEKSSGPGLDLAMSLQVEAAIYCSLGRLENAIPVLERSIETLDLKSGSDHAMAKFSGFMQLGDTYSMLGRVDRSISSYEYGLKIQIEALGDLDPRVAESCRYLAEAYVQAMEFDEAEKLCQKSLEIHREHNAPASIEEAGDRRLMALIYEAKEEYESALEELVLASMVMIAAGQENEVAAIDVGIGNIYMSLCRFDEAIFSYQKALTVFKSTRGDDHPAVALVYNRLADVYCKTGKLRESRSYCDNALRIFSKPVTGTAAEEIASGLTEISAIYEALNEHGEALKILHMAMKLVKDTPGQHSMVAGIEAQLGLMFYKVGKYGEAEAPLKMLWQSSGPVGMLNQSSLGFC
ncbi:protein KINESIN LIGHT CHAIN-RELATED [Salix suchowensis]|nr:protein KINESIN LIGHT CHAIN-RELATED [Salix suchowensis]